MPFNRKFVNVIGSGFAGIECALFLASHGVKVHVFDSGKVFEKDVYEEELTLKKEKSVTLLKKELSFLGSPLIREQERCFLSEKEVLLFGKRLLQESENIKIIEACVHELNPNEINIIATGSYTDEGMTNLLISKLGGMLCHATMPLYPIFENRGNVDKKIDEIQNVGLQYEEYLNLVNSIIEQLNILQPKKEDLVKGSLERLALNGRDEIRNFCLRPVITGCDEEKPYATIKLKRSDKGYLGLGLATRLPRASQQQIFDKVLLKHGYELAKEGKILNVCHICSPFTVNEFHRALNHENLFFAGSILGISGYVDCIASGLYTALNVLKYIQEREMIDFPRNTAIGKMVRAINNKDRIMGQFVEDYKIFSDEDLNKTNIIESIAKNSFLALEKYREVYNGKYV